jgi:spore coat protein U-like protein
MLCSSADFPLGAGPQPVQFLVFRGAAAAVPPLYMTLGGLPASTGVQYQLCADSACQSPFSSNSAILDAYAAGPNPFIPRVGVFFYVKLIGPYPSGAQLSAGTYSDALTVYIIY